MDRDALVARNQRLAHAFHETSTRHRVRQNLMHLVTRLPITPLRTNTRRILLIRPDHIGDVLLATPTVRAIKQANPYHEIHMLVGPWSAPVLSNFQEIDLVLTTPFPGFDRSETTEGQQSHPPSISTTRESLTAIATYRIPKCGDSPP